MTIKKTYIFLSLLVLIAALGYVNRSAIIIKVLPNAVTKVMAGDKIADLGDGMHIALCGAGGPMPSSSSLRTLCRGHSERTKCLWSMPAAAAHVI